LKQYKNSIFGPASALIGLLDPPPLSQIFGAAHVCSQSSMPPTVFGKGRIMILVENRHTPSALIVSPWRNAKKECISVLRPDFYVGHVFLAYFETLGGENECIHIILVFRLIDERFVVKYSFRIFIIVVYNIF